jgi:cobalt-zinc-cadmium efflux system outer membrane protein
MGEKTWPEKPARQGGSRKILGAAVLLPALLGFTNVERAEAGSEEGIPAHLSLAEAEQIFLARGLDLLIAQYGAQGAEGDLRAAGAHPNPGLDFTASFGPRTSHDIIGGTLGPPTGPVNRTLGLAIGLTDNAAIGDQLSGKRSLRIEASAKALAAARLNVDDVRRIELSQLKQAYAAAVLAALDVNAAKESFDTFDKQLKLNQRRYDEGTINGLDLSRVLQAQMEALQAVDQAESAQKQAMASLLFLLGARDAIQNVTLTTGIEYLGLSQLKDASLPSLHDLALRNRTDVKIAEANLEQSQVMVRQARRARVPDIALSLGYSEQCNSDTCSSVPTFNAGLQGNVPVFYLQQGEIKRAESNALAAQRTLDKAKAQVLSDVTQAYAGFVAGKSQVERMEGKLLEQAKLSRDLAQHMCQKGAASLIDFLDAQRSYVASQIEYHQDLADYWSAVYQLEQATSTSLR